MLVAGAFSIPLGEASLNNGPRFLLKLEVQFFVFWDKGGTTDIVRFRI